MQFFFSCWLKSCIGSIKNYHDNKYRKQLAVCSGKVLRCINTTWISPQGNAHTKKRSRSSPIDVTARIFASEKNPDVPPLSTVRWVLLSPSISIQFKRCTTHIYRESEKSESASSSTRWWNNFALWLADVVIIIIIIHTRLVIDWLVRLESQSVRCYLHFLVCNKPRRWFSGLSWLSADFPSTPIAMVHVYKHAEREKESGGVSYQSFSSRLP